MLAAARLRASASCWLKAGGCSQLLEAACWPQGYPRHQSSKGSFKSERVSKEASHPCNTVCEGTAHPLCHIPLIRSKSQVLLTLKERGSYKGMNSTRGGSWEVTVESVHHKSNVSSRCVVQTTGVTGAQKEYFCQQTRQLHRQRWPHHCELMPSRYLGTPILM